MLTVLIKSPTYDNRAFIKNKLRNSQQKLPNYNTVAAVREDPPLENDKVTTLLGLKWRGQKESCPLANIVPPTSHSN